MSSNQTMKTEPGGEQTQYESASNFQEPHKKSGGQFGNPETTTDASQTREAKQTASDRGERTAENIRYGQGISEGGMGGTTTGQSGTTTQAGYGRVPGSGEGDGTSVEERKAQGYGGKSDMDPNVGA